CGSWKPPSAPTTWRRPGTCRSRRPMRCGPSCSTTGSSTMSSTRGRSPIRLPGRVTSSVCPKRAGAAIRWSGFPWRRKRCSAARGEAHQFEARALWPRVLARLFAADLVSAAEAEGPVPAVQIVDGDDAALAREAFREWSAAAEALRSVAGDLAPWIPRVLPPQHLAILADAPREPSSTLLVYATP